MRGVRRVTKDRAGPFVHNEGAAGKGSLWQLAVNLRRATQTRLRERHQVRQLGRKKE
jgi:hypothetical protein